MFEKLGLRRVPWTIRVYLLLLLTFILFAIVVSLPIGPQGLRPIASDGLKMVLGALLGALSLIGEGRFRVEASDGFERRASDESFSRE